MAAVARLEQFQATIDPNPDEAWWSSKVTILLCGQLPRLRRFPCEGDSRHDEDENLDPLVLQDLQAFNALEAIWPVVMTAASPPLLRRSRTP